MQSSVQNMGGAMVGMGPWWQRKRSYMNTCALVCFQYFGEYIEDIGDCDLPSSKGIWLAGARVERRLIFYQVSLSTLSMLYLYVYVSYLNASFFFKESKFSNPKSIRVKCPL